MTDVTARLEVTNLNKTFRGVHVLNSVSLRVVPGEIHGLIGQNGSGKSVMVKILSGYHVPDHGAVIKIDGRSLRLPAQPDDLRKAGVSFVHQDLGLFDSLTVAENIYLSMLATSASLRRVRHSKQIAVALEVLSRLGISHIDPSVKVSTLSPVERATVAIARALVVHRPGGGLLILDESTNALPRDALEHVYALLRRITDDGGSVLLVSHKLDEVLSVTDRVSILKDGSVVAGEVMTSQTSVSELARYILGHDLEHDIFVREPQSSGRNVEVSDLTGHRVSNVAFRLCGGEILGLTGLAGSGFEEIPYLLTGVLVADSGVLRVGDRAIDLHRRNSVRALHKLGVALVPARRVDQGLVLGNNILENVSLPRVSTKGRFWFIGRRWQQTEAWSVVNGLGVKPAEPLRLVGELSGGNQQKVLLGKWIEGSPSLLVLHEPTQAVDIGARRDILATLRQLADGGTAIVLSSLDVNDLVAVCDRVLILRDGCVVSELARLDRNAIVEMTYGDDPLGASNDASS